MKYTTRISTVIINLAIMMALLTGLSAVAQTQNSLSRPQPLGHRQTTIPFDGDNSEHFYSFTGKGEISITLDIKAGSYNSGVTVNFLNSYGKDIASSVLIQAINAGTDRIVKTIPLGRNYQTVILKLKSISYGSSLSSAGTLKITINGNVKDTPQSSGNVKDMPQSNSNDRDNRSEDKASSDISAGPNEEENTLDNPTILHAQSTTMEFEGRNEEYFLGFYGRGKVEITYDVKAKGGNAGVYITLLDKSGRTLAGQEVVQAINKGTSRFTQSVELNKPQPIIIKVVGTGYGSNSSFNPGTLRITFNSGLVSDSK